MPSHSTAYLFLVVNMALWGGALVVARGVHEIAPPFALTFWRWAVAVVILLPIIWRRLPREIPLAAEARRSVFLICGYMAVGTMLSVLAVNYTTAINATVINGTQPAVTALATLVVLREHLSIRQALGIASAFLGMIVMISQASFGVLVQMNINMGDLIMLGAVICWSSYAVELHRGTHLPSPEVLLFLIACAGVVVGLPFYVYEEIFLRQFRPTSGSLAAIIYLGLGSTVLAVYLWNSAIRSVGANRASAFLNLIPLFGAGLAVAFLGERLFGYHVIGVGLVITGIFLAVKRTAPRPVSAPSVEEEA